jgi:DNA-directed RNA polymerase alpha subunit
VRANIKSVNELTELTLKQAREIDGLGSKYFSEVKKALTVKGLSFKK